VGFFTYMALRALLTPPLLDIGVSNIEGFLAAGFGGIALAARMVGCQQRWLLVGALGMVLLPLCIHWTMHPGALPAGPASAEVRHAEAVAVGILAAHLVERVWDRLTRASGRNQL
jgi:hypothetical protein